jgi:hypothetical protein
VSDPNPTTTINAIYSLVNWVLSFYFEKFLQGVFFFNLSDGCFYLGKTVMFVGIFEFVPLKHLLTNQALDLLKLTFLHQMLSELFFVKHDAGHSTIYVWTTKFQIIFEILDDIFTFSLIRYIFLLVVTSFTVFKSECTKCVSHDSANLASGKLSCCLWTQWIWAFGQTS